MKNDQLHILDKKKQATPFRVPDGYFEGLTKQIMDNLPETPVKEEIQISLMDRVRPWLYIAAVFAGLAFFFRTVIGPNTASDHSDMDLQANMTTKVSSYIAEIVEDEEFLEYLEDRYTDVLLAEEIAYFD